MNGASTNHLWQSTLFAFAAGLLTVAFRQNRVHLVLDRPVIDKTGITGKFDIHIEFGIDAATPKFLAGGELGGFPSKTEELAGPSIFTAIQLLGLKLEAAKGPREFLVIDHMERPTEN